MNEDRDRASTEHLVARCRDRDEAAFRELIRRFHNPLLYYVRRLVEDDFLAEDVMQEVWMGAWSGLRSLRNPDAFSVWIFRIARNRSSRFWKKRFREHLGEELSESNEPAAEPLVIERDTTRHFHQLLERLPLPQRESLTLLLIEGMSYEEIAAVTDVPLGTVRSRIHYGKRTLRGWLEAENV